MDLYHIPGDTGGQWRFNKAVDWVANFPNEIVPSAKKYFIEKKWDNDDKVWFILLYSACYSYPTALIMHDLLDYKTITEEEFDKFWEKYKPKLIFQSDRRYIKNMNQFKHIVFEFLDRSKRHPYNYINSFVTDDKVKTYENLYKEITSWRYYGRFGTGLFMYNYTQMMDVPMDYPEYDWSSGATITSAIFHILYMDQEALDFEKNKLRLTPDMKEQFNAIALSIENELVQRTGKQYSIMNVSSDLCSFRKLFKKVRYNGFYVDRQLVELNTLRKNLSDEPELLKIVNFVYDTRKDTVDHKFLGEIGGWNDIRKELNDKFLTTGQL